MRRIVGSLMVLALTFGSGCSESDEAAGGASGEGATVQARSVPAIWADILVQRDRVHEAVSKGTDMWHEDCAQVSAAAAALDALAIELNQRVAQLPSAAAHLYGIQIEIGYFQQTISALRSSAIEETVGLLPGLMIALDALMETLEIDITREEIGSESVVTRPGFNPVHPPPPPSPI